MKKLLVALIVPLALVASGCDRKAPDSTNPKTSSTQPSSPMAKNSTTPADMPKSPSAPYDSSSSQPKN